MAKAASRRPGEDAAAGPVLVELPNGLKVVMQPARFAPVVSLSVWVNVGSADETAAEAGLAHLHEHMIFKGTARRGVGAIAAEVEGAGGEINAFTSYDQTCYYLTLGRDELALGLDILADAVGGAAFDAAELKKEIEVVLEEMRLYRDLPAHYVSERAWAELFRAHPYGRPILGTREVLTGLKRADVLRFYRKHYRPANMTLAVAGDFELDHARGLVEKLFGAWKAGATARVARPSEPPPTSFRGLALRDPIRQTHLCLAWPGVSWDAEFATELDLLAMILSHGDSSRLEHRIKSMKGLVHDVSAHAFAGRDPGAFSVEAMTNREMARAACQAILREVYRLRVDAVTEEELDRAKRNLEASFIGKHETAGGIGHALGYSVALTGDVHLERDYLRRAMAADRLALRRAAQKLLTHQRLTAAVLTPEGDSFSVGEAERLSAEAFSGWNAPAKVAGKGKEIQAPALVGCAGRKRRMKRAALANGVRLVVQESDHAPVLAIRVLAQGGLRYEPAAQSGLANFAASLLSRGTTNKSAIVFAKIVEGMAGSVRGFSGFNSIGVASEFLSRDWERGLELTAEAALSPVFSALEARRKKDEIAGLIREQRDQPGHVARELFAKLLFGAHPYARPLLGTEDSLRAMTAEDAAAHWRELLDPRNLVVAIAGDVDFDEAAKRVEALFGKLKARRFKPLKLAAPPLPAGVQRGVESRRKEQTHLVAGFLGCPLGGADEEPLHLLNAALTGQGGRLFLELRDKQHLAYNVYSFYREGVERGAFGVYMATKPESADRALQGMLDELRRAVARPPKGHELARAKRHLIGSLQLDLQTVGAIALTTGLNELLGLGWRHHLGAADRIRRVTAEQLATVARKYLTLDRMVIAKVGDFARNGE